MRRRTVLTAVLTLAMLAASTTAAEPVIKGTGRHTALIADGRGKVSKISAEGKIVWQYNAPRAHDAWLLANGNVLLTYAGRGKGGAMEISPDKKIVWQYELKGEVHTVQRLADGNTLVSDCANGRLIEVTRDKKVVWQYTDTKATGAVMGVQLIDVKGPPLR